MISFVPPPSPPPRWRRPSPRSDATPAIPGPSPWPAIDASFRGALSFFAPRKDRSGKTGPLSKRAGQLRSLRDGALGIEFGGHIGAPDDMGFQAGREQGVGEFA